MGDTLEEQENPPKKPSKFPIILWFLLACIAGGVGFYATWSGKILSSDSHTEDMANDKSTNDQALANVTYIDIDPLTISLRAPSKSQYLRFRASLEVVPDEADAVTNLLPRVTDVLNNYLRALEPADLEDPAALARLRGQMLRRIQVVAGLGKVNDLLIMEFVLN